MMTMRTGLVAGMGFLGSAGGGGAGGRFLGEQLLGEAQAAGGRSAGSGALRRSVLLEHDPAAPPAFGDQLGNGGEVGLAIAEIGGEFRLRTPVLEFEVAQPIPMTREQLVGASCDRE